MSARFVDGLAAGLLGRHVGGGAHDDAHPGRRRHRHGWRFREVLSAGRAEALRYRCGPVVRRQFRQPEIEDLHRAVRRDLDVRRLQIAMDDALLVCGFKSVDDLPRDGQHLVNW
jgi:hypothetical protein